MVWIWISLALLAVVAVCLLSKLHIRFIISRHGKDDHFILSVKGLFGLFKWDYEAPVVKLLSIGEGLMMESGENERKAETAVDNRLNINLDKLRLSWEHYRALLRHTSGLVKWIHWLMSKLHCTKLRWHTNVGTNDAAETAIYAGTLWALKTAPLGYILKHIQMNTKPDIAVHPTYNLPQFSMEATVLMHTRLYWMVIAVFLIFPRVLRVKGGLRVWRRLLFRPRSKVGGPKPV